MALVLPVKLGPDGEYETQTDPHYNEFYDIDLTNQVDDPQSSSFETTSNTSPIKTKLTHSPSNKSKPTGNKFDGAQARERELLSNPKILMHEGLCSASLAHRLRFAVCFSSTLLAIASSILALVIVIAEGVKPDELGGSVLITLGAGVICIALSISGCLGAALDRKGAFWAFLLLVTTLQTAQLIAVLTVFWDSDYGENLKDDGMQRMFVYVALTFSGLTVVPNVVAALILLCVGKKSKKPLCGAAWCDGISVSFTRTALLLCTLISCGIAALALLRYLQDFSDPETAVVATTDASKAVLNEVDATLIATVAGACMCALGGLSGLYGSIRRGYCQISLGITLMLIGCVLVLASSAYLTVRVDQGFSDLTNTGICNSTSSLSGATTLFECMEEDYFFLGMLFVLMAVFVLVLTVFSMVVCITDAEEVYESVSF